MSNPSLEITTVSTARALVDILDREGVTTIFGIPGGPVLPLFDELADHPRIRIVLTKHEQAAAFAAFAYARVTGRLGVCVATLGPGATNLLAGLPVALMASAPILALTGQVQTTAFGRGAHQESTGWFTTPDQAQMSRGTTKHTATCVEPATFADQVRHAIRIATAGRPGPAHLILPANLLHKEVPYRPLQPGQYRSVAPRAVDREAIEVLAREVRAARHPLVLAGERAWSPHGSALQALIDDHALPVAVDLACKSAVDERSPCYLGVLGVMGHKALETYLRETCDLLVAVGQTFNEISTLSWDPALARVPLVQLDCDPLEIGKAYPVWRSIVGDIPATLQALSLALGELPDPNRETRAAGVAAHRQRHPLWTSEEAGRDTVPLLPQRVVRDLQAALPEDARVLLDSSKWNRWIGRFLTAPQGTVVTAHDYEPMGWAVAGAIGAKVAEPDRPVISISGDGAFLMSAMELATAANHRLPVVWIVMNDQRYGVIHDLQRLLYGGRVVGSAYDNPDFVQFARAFGLHGETVTEPGQLTVALQAALARDIATVLDVRFDPDEPPPVRPRSVLITTEMGLPNVVPGPDATRALLKLLKEK